MSFASDFTQFSEFRHISQHSARNLCKMADLAIFSTRIFDGTLCRRAGCPHPAAQGKRIPSPVCTPRALASRRALARNDSAPRWGRRDTWVPPYGVRRSSRAGGGVRPYKAEQEPCETGRRGRRPLRNHKGCVQWADRGARPYNGTAGTACPTNRRGAARTAKFQNFFFPLSAPAGLRRLYSDDTGRPPVL